jgi:hypothetical protein
VGWCDSSSSEYDIDAFAAAVQSSSGADCTSQAILASAHEATERVSAACDEHADIDSNERYGCAVPFHEWPLPSRVIAARFRIVSMREHPRGCGHVQMQ